MVDSKCGSWSVLLQDEHRRAVQVFTKCRSLVREDSEVKTNEALWFASLQLTSVEVFKLIPGTEFEPCFLTHF